MYSAWVTAFFALVFVLVMASGRMLPYADELDVDGYHQTGVAQAVVLEMQAQHSALLKYAAENPSASGTVLRSDIESYFSSNYVPHISMEHTVSTDGFATTYLVVLPHGLSRGKIAFSLYERDHYEGSGLQQVDGIANSAGLNEFFHNDATGAPVLAPVISTKVR